MATSKETYTSIYSATNSSVYGSEFPDTKTNLANSSGYSSYYGGATSSTVREQDTANTATASGSDNHVDETTFSLTNNINLKSGSFVQDEKLAHEVLEKAGPADKYQRKEYAHDISAAQAAEKEHFSSSTYHETGNDFSQSRITTEHFHTNATSAPINQDPDPIRILKPNNQNLVYKQQVNIRYLQPPTPPPQAPIIIREKQLPPPPPQPPIIIRQTAPATATPPPLIIRERAPTPPPVLEPTIIERPIPAPPLPPRQVIIERIPAPPTKPRPIIYEKWLPYKQTRRPVIIQKFKPIIVQAAPKNIIIEYEKAKAVAVRQVVEEGVFRADPNTYQSAAAGNAELRIVDRINDLPIENSRFLSYLNAQNNISTEYTEYDKYNLENIDQYLSHVNIHSSKYSTYSKNSSMPNLADTNYYETSTGVQTLTTSTTYPASAEYETITTTVPQNLAEKIIAEAQAAGATISRSSSVVRNGNYGI